MTNKIKYIINTKTTLSVEKLTNRLPMIVIKVKIFVKLYKLNLIVYSLKILKLLKINHKKENTKNKKNWNLNIRNFTITKIDKNKNANFKLNPKSPKKTLSKK